MKVEDNVQAAMHSQDPVALTRLLLDHSHLQHEDMVVVLGLIGYRHRIGING